MYWALSLASAIAAILLSFTPFARQIDNNIYDFLYRLRPAPAHTSPAVVLAIDEQALLEGGGIGRMRAMLAGALEALKAQPPRVTVVDLTLADRGPAADDAALERALTGYPNLVLGSEMMPDGSRWQDPPPFLRRHAAALGHVNALPDQYDAVNREIPLERVAGRERRWALALEAYRLWAGAAEIDASPRDVRVGQVEVAAPWEQGRPMRVRFRPSADLPRLSLAALLKEPARAAGLTGKAVFIGVTAQSAARDRLSTPISYQVPMPGVEVHAQAFDTLAGGEFLSSVPLSAAALAAVAAACAAAALYTWLQGWLAYLASALLLAACHAVPAVLLFRGEVLAPSALLASAWFAILSAGAWRHFVVRRSLVKSESDRARYQQALHFVAHELRTPLTAIQGSGELISRYNLPEEKRRQIGNMIHSESKRLARMISTFLDVEKLEAGQMELRKTAIPVAELLTTCAERARPLADRKRIRIDCAGAPGLTLSGDRELLEYALYNLITNAVKYSPEETGIEVSARNEGEWVSLAVLDHGYGMSQAELKNIFRRFYRTASAERSGETGTGIGLSIVDQIVGHHGGRIRVASTPGKGSCFTIELPATAGVSELPGTLH